MILDIELASNDRLWLNGVSTSGPIDYPVPKFYTPGSLNITFMSDASQVGKGFNLAYACHGKSAMIAVCYQLVCGVDNSVKGIVKAATEDCSVRRYLKVIHWLLYGVDYF